MGADCCGGSKSTTATEAKKTDFGEASERLAPHSEDKTWEDVVKEKEHYYAHRVELFKQIQAKYLAAVEKAKEENVKISIILPDGSSKEGVKGATTPLDIANSISKSLAKKTIVAKVDGQVWDLCRPLEADCALQLLSFDEPDGKDVR